MSTTARDRRRLPHSIRPEARALYDVSDRFLDVISGSHRAVVRVQVLPTASGQFPQFGANPTGGIELPLLDGDVKLTSTADVNGSGRLHHPR
jgi:hypothetical protein